MNKLTSFSAETRNQTHNETKKTKTLPKKVLDKMLVLNTKLCNNKQNH